MCIVMAIFIGIWILTVLCTSQPPTTAQLDSALSLLSNNALDNKPAPGSGAVLVHAAKNGSSAAEACELLGETLWARDSQVNEFTLSSTLSYLVYQRTINTGQLFWIRSGAKIEHSTVCNAMDHMGTTRHVDCNMSLPTLCSQNAPLSNIEMVDGWLSMITNNSLPYQITHQVGNLSLTGFRGFYAWKFLGVRYAPQPKRFEWSTVYQGSGHESVLSFGHDCPQQPHDFPGPFSEDCLFISIWTPHLPHPGPDTTSLPQPALKAVMFYIFGGGLFSGSSANPDADCTQLASRGDVVCVAINYRLGNLGFLVLDDGVHNGNYGLQDIVTALKWVQKNIHFFGGDASRVTIFGESGGGSAVRAMLASPLATGLFSGAIPMSQPAGLLTYAPWGNYTSVQAQYDAVTRLVLNLTGCINPNIAQQLGCLQSYPAQDLVSLGGPVPSTAQAFYPVVDGRLLTTAGITALHGGPRYAGNVSVMIGHDRDEFGIEIEPPPAKIGTGAEYLSFLNNRYGADVWAIVHPPGANASDLAVPQSANETFWAINRLGTSAAFHCLDQAFAFSAARHASFASVYAFEFNRTYQPPHFTNRFCDVPPAGDPDGDEYMRCHAGEKMDVHGVVGMGLATGRTPDRDGKDVLFSQLVVDYWTAFARAGDPNPEEAWLRARGFASTLERVTSSGGWRAVSSSGYRAREQVMSLQWESRMVGWEDEEICGLFGFPLDYYETAIF